MHAAFAACVCLVLVGGACAPTWAHPSLAFSVSPESTSAAAEKATPTPRVPAAHTPTPRVPAAHTPTAGAQPVAAPMPALDGALDGILPDDTSYGLVLEDLASGARAAVNDTTLYPSASLYKLGLAWVVLRQVDASALNLDSMLEIQDEDAIEPEPDGGYAVGETPTIGEALAAMIGVSSNASAHALLRLVGRPAFTAEMDRIGLAQTRVPDDGIAVTSAADMAHLLRLIATSPDLSGQSRALLQQDMANVAPPDALRDSLPNDISIYDKTGNLDDASNVSALLGSSRATAILVVIDTGVDPGDARAIISQAGLIAYRALLQ